MSLAAARKFAIEAHGNQWYGVLPYEEHLRSVERTLLRFGVTDETVLAAGWLHDVMEDTCITYGALVTRFGMGVASLVDAVTEEPGANRKERAIKTYTRIRRYGAPAVILKVADRIANTEASIQSRDRHLKMYREEFPAFSTALFASGECDAMWEYLRSISTEQLK